MSSFRDNDITTPWPRELSDIASVSLCLPLYLSQFNGRDQKTTERKAKRKRKAQRIRKQQTARADKQGMVTLQDDVTLRDLYRADRYQHTNERS